MEDGLKKAFGSSSTPLRYTLANNGRKDNFDIDIYGEGEGNEDYDNNGDYQENEDYVENDEQQTENSMPQQDGSSDSVAEDMSHTASAQSITQPEQTSPTPQQGVKRKESSDERAVDSGATNAVLISDMQWWTTEDELRRWASEVDAEDELKEVTFSEHKVNGKSKGYDKHSWNSASLQASTAMRHKIESLTTAATGGRKYNVVYANAQQNPFKTMPKDAPARTKDDRARSTSAPYNAPSQPAYNGGYRGRGGFNRGGGYNRGGYNQNQNYGAQMGGFQGNMGMGNNFGGFNRGGMMGNMRGWHERHARWSGSDGYESSYDGHEPNGYGHYVNESYDGGHGNAASVQSYVQPSHGWR